MATKTLPDARAYLREVADELLGLREIDNLEMYRALTTMGHDLPPLREAEKIDANFVHGCISNVYVAAEAQEGAIIYRGSSESHVVRGYLAILVEALSGLPPAEIPATHEAVEAFARETEIKATLTPNRANAFANIYALMVHHAAAIGVNSAGRASRPDSNAPQSPPR